MVMFVTVFKKILSLLIVPFALLMMAGGAYLVIVATYPQLTPPSAKEPRTTTDSNPTARTTPTLFIPKIDIEIPFSSSGIEALDNGAWWRSPDSGNPKDGGNFVLAAHRFQMGWTPAQTARQSPLYHIDKLQRNDTILVDYEGIRYEYVITDIRQVEPNATEIEQPTSDDRLTLYSCTLGGTYDGREVVVAHKVSEK